MPQAAFLLMLSVPTSAFALLMQVASPQAPPAIVQVQARSETAPAPSIGDSVDDVAIWIHPTQLALSLVIGTDKKGGLLVYDLDGNQRQHLAGRPNNVDLRYRFPLAGHEVALLTSGMRDQNLLAVYAVDPSTRRLRDVAARPIALGFDVRGSCMYFSRASGEVYFFGISAEDGVVQQWRLFDGGSGRVDAECVRSFDVGGMCEGCVADDENAWFFVSEEKVGIWRYGAEPDGGETRIRIDGVDGVHLESDVEGLTIYYAGGGGGYLIASSQGNDRFAVYERRAPHAHRLTFEVVASSERGVDAVTGTDGIDVTNLALGTVFPGGFFAAQDESNPPGNQNFKLVDWRDIARAADPPLVVDPDYDAFRAREPGFR